MFPAHSSLFQRGLDYIWRRLFASSFGAAMSARLGWLMPKEGTSTGKGTSSPRLPVVSLPASPLTCPPLADFFQACFLSTADSSGYDKQRASCNADHLQGCRSPPRRTAAHAAGLSHGHSARWARARGWGEQGRNPSPEQTSRAVDCDICIAPLLRLQPELSLVFPGCSFYPDPSKDTALFSSAQPSACF